jgi:hypothetical protein
MDMGYTEVIALIGSVAWLLIVIEMIRRKHLSEGYSLLWLLSGFVLVGLSFWRQGLEVLAQILGIYYAPTALFVVAFGFVMLLLLQQSAWICRLEKRNRRLAQTISLLEHQLRGQFLPLRFDEEEQTSLLTTGEDS